MTAAQKTPLSRTLPAFTSARALDEISKLGLGVPGTVKAVSGAIVTINFEVTGLTLPPVQMPLGSPEYIRLPIQPGDKGVAVPASFYLGGISGLGGGTADDTQRGNLSTLYWVPIGSKNFSAVDPNTLVLYGVAGAKIQDSVSPSTTLSVTSAGVAINSTTGNTTTNANTSMSYTAGTTVSYTAGTSITFTVGSHSIVISASGVTIDDRLFLAHQHTLTQPGTGTGGPVL